MSSIQSLIDDFGPVLASASDSRRKSILQQVTDLFIESADRYSPDQVEIFDVVLKLLMDKAKPNDLIALSEKLAPIANAPANVIERLAQDNEATIAGPVLAKSPALSDATLTNIASNKGAGHLLAIASRARIDEPMTDLLINRAGPDAAAVLHKIAGNENARVSHVGFVKLINVAKRDQKLAKLIAGRGDLPAELEPFLKLLG